MKINFITQNLEYKAGTSCREAGWLTTAKLRQQTAAEARSGGKHQPIKLD